MEDITVTDCNVLSHMETRGDIARIEVNITFLVLVFVIIYFLLTLLSSWTFFLISCSECLVLGSLFLVHGFW